jgi:hypothetical protein
LLLGPGTHPIPLAFQIPVTFPAGAEVGFEIEPLRDQEPRRSPGSFGLVEAQPEILGNPPERVFLGAGVEYGKDHLEAAEMDALEREPKRTGLHRLLREHSPDRPRTDVPTPAGDVAKADRICDRWLARGHVREHREGGHLIDGEGHIWMDQNR